MPYMRGAQALRALGADRRRKDQARRLHRAREPQLRQSLPRLSRRRYGFERQELAGQDDRACSRSSLTTQLRYRSLGARRCSRPATEPASCPGTHCRMDGFNKEVRRAAGLTIRSTSTFRTANRSRTSTWRTSGFWPTGCSSRSSTRASSRINTSSPRRPKSSVNLPIGQWGCDGRPGDRGRRRSRSSARYGQNQQPCFDYQTLGDELDDAELSVALLHQRVLRQRRRAVFWSGYQAVKHISYGPDWEDIVTPPKEVSHRRAARQARELYVDHAGLRRLRSRRLRRRLSGRRGSRRSSTRSARASSGIRRRSSCSGTIGAASTITFRRHY